MTGSKTITGLPYEGHLIAVAAADTIAPEDNRNRPQ